MEHLWKEASSVILLSPSTFSASEIPSFNVSDKINITEDFIDYDVLTVRGNQRSSYLKSSYTFPGGQLDASDFSQKWWSVFDQCDVTLKDINAWADIEKPRPPIITDSLTLEELRRSSVEDEHFLPIEVALRICAIRHTFHETGILLISRVSPKISSKKALKEHNLIEWRERVRNSPAEFIELCTCYGLCPDLWSLSEWWNWLTPASVGRNTRYDTIFYICTIDDQLGDGHWTTPGKLLDGHWMGKYLLSPPQIYELSRLQNLINLSDVKEFSRNRQSHGIDRWLPVVSIYSDGAISVLPGDEYYPSNIEYFAKKPVRSYALSIEEIRNKSKMLNRMELRSPTCEVVCNIDLSRGHLRPVSTVVPQNIITAKL